MRLLSSTCVASLFALVFCLGAPSVWAAGFIVSEILLENDTLVDAEFLDEDGERQPWVELKNTGESQASLDGWSIAPNPNDPSAQFLLPDVDVEPGGTVIVWLSGKDRVAPGSALHADFSPVESRELHLFDAASQLVDSFAAPIPSDRSMGRCSEIAGSSFYYYYDDPSPGEENSYVDVIPFTFLDRHVSLTVGQPLDLEVWPAVDVVWSSDNPFVTVDQYGEIEATIDVGPPWVEATITATEVGGTHSETIGVTIVPWRANVSRIELTPQSTADRILASDDDGVFFSVGTALYESSGGLHDGVAVGTLPDNPTPQSRLMTTPFGAFFEKEDRVYRSTDLTNWTLERQLGHGTLRHMVDSYWDSTTQTGYVFAGEYSSELPDSRHKVHRGTYPTAGPATWDVILDFDPLSNWQAAPSALEAVRHVHVVVVDPYTGDVYVVTGDSNAHARILHSKDFGSSFELLGMGSQDWRALAIWFTEEYIYWNMDTSSVQSIWRLARSSMTPGGSWPSVTPELDSGTTTPGLKYYVTRESTSGRFPVGVGETWTETSATVLDVDHAVRALDDPAFDARELVATIANGPHWFQGFAMSEQGDVVSLMASEPGVFPYRDRRSRLFGIKEGPGGVPNVQELALVEPELYYWSSSLTQVIPKAQGPDGSVYFASRKASHDHYVGQLDWYDDASSAPAAPVPPASPVECKPAPEPGALVSWVAGLVVLCALQRRRSVAS